MTIPSLSILKYIPDLTFPFPVWDESGKFVSLSANEIEFRFLCIGKVLVATGSETRLKLARLTVPVGIARAEAQRRAARAQWELIEEGRRIARERERPPGEYMARMVSARKFIRRIHVTGQTDEGVEERTGLSYWEHKRVPEVKAERRLESREDWERTIAPRLAAPVVKACESEHPGFRGPLLGEDEWDRAALRLARGTPGYRPEFHP